METLTNQITTRTSTHNNHINEASVLEATDSVDLENPLVLRGFGNPLEQGLFAVVFAFMNGTLFWHKF